MHGWWWQQTRGVVSLEQHPRLTDCRSLDGSGHQFNHSIQTTKTQHCSIILSFAWIFFTVTHSPHLSRLLEPGNCNEDAMCGTSTSWIGKSMCVLLIRNSWRHTHSCTTRTVEIVFFCVVASSSSTSSSMRHGWCFGGKTMCDRKRLIKMQAAIT